jgi:predicted acetyltransferase
MASLLVALAVMVRSFFALWPGLHVSVVGMVAVGQPSFLRICGVAGSLKRSYNLDSGNWCYIFLHLDIFYIRLYAHFGYKVRSFLSLLSLSAAVPSHSHKNVGRMFKDQ